MPVGRLVYEFYTELSKTATKMSRMMTMIIRMMTREREKHKHSSKPCILTGENVNSIKFYINLWRMSYESSGEEDEEKQPYAQI